MAASLRSGFGRQVISMPLSCETSQTRQKSSEFQLLSTSHVICMCRASSACLSFDADVRSGIVRQVPSTKPTAPGIGFGSSDRDGFSKVIIPLNQMAFLLT